MSQLVDDFSPDSAPEFFVVSAGDEARAIAFRRLSPDPEKGVRPGVVWLGGFKSDMKGTKALALDAFCRSAGRAFLRFDYSGHGESEHGESGGDFAKGTISRWLEESLALIAAKTTGPQILVGSSMGGWIALLIARALAARGEQDRIAGMVLIAPAVDFTERLMWQGFSDDIRRQIMEGGVWLRPSAYAPEPTPITRALIEDGRRHLLFGGEIRAYGPVHILQGMNDSDVPWPHAVALIEHFDADPAILTLVREGDHRLSRDEDITRLIGAVAAIA